MKKVISKSFSTISILNWIVFKCTLSKDHISTMEERMRQSFDKGLNKDTHKDASVKCFPTYVRDLPSGTEVGKFLALDLGGTNFRVVLVEIGLNEK